MKAYLKKGNLPDAPTPTKACHCDDPREAEYWQRFAEHAYLMDTSYRHGDGKKPPMWTNDKINKLKRLHKEGYTIKEISREVALSEKQVLNKIYYLIRLGQLQKRNKYLTGEQRKKAIDMYKHGMTQKAIGKHFGVSQASISATLRKAANNE